MKISYRLYGILLFSVLLFTACGHENLKSDSALVQESGKSTALAAPMAKKLPHEMTIHGDSRQDPWYWLRERENPEVIDYLNAENAYTDAMLQGEENLVEELYQEMIGRLKQDDSSVPYLLNGYWYFSRYEEGKEYPVYARKADSPDAEEEILLDVNVMAEGYAYFNVSGLTVSPDNRFLAFGVDTVSRRQYTIMVKDLSTGEILPDRIVNTTGRAAWAADNSTLFYDRKDETLRPYQIYRYSVGREDSETLVFQEPEDTYATYVYKSKSREFIFIASYSTLSSEFRYIPSDKPMSEPVLVHPREEDLLYSVDHFGEHFYILTNWEAQNFRLMQTPVSAASKDNWSEVLAHRGDVLLESLELFSDYYVLEERSEGLTRLRFLSYDGSLDRYMSMDEEAYTIRIETNPEFNTRVFRYGYTSLTTPYTVYDYNLDSRESILLKRDEVVGGYDPEDYVTRRIFVTARDGASVPVSLVHRKDLDTSRPNPLLLYGYGSYGITMDPSFRSYRLSLLDRNFIYAVAHIRGSQMMGRQWYEDGKLLNKMNTFTDFIDCGRWLVDEGYSSSSQMFAMGGSAGGLLIGAVINMAPDLFNGVVAAVPFVDVVTTMLDESIPLTTGEYDEWGNPNEEEYYHYMLSYSPYDQVREMDYPNILITTGLHDSQVQYWEPAKWTAKLRDMKTDDRLLLLKTDMEAGHGGASGRFKAYRDIALDFAFFLKLLK